MTTLSKIAPSDCQDGELPALIVGIVLSVVYMIYGMSFPGRAVLGRIEEEPFLARVHIGTHKLLELTDVLDDIGEERIFPTVRSAVNTAVALLLLASLAFGWLLGGPILLTRRVLAFVTSARNVTVALLVVNTTFPQTDADVRIMVFALAMLITDIALAAYWKRSPPLPS